MDKNKIPPPLTGAWFKEVSARMTKVLATAWKTHPLVWLIIGPVVLVLVAGAIATHLVFLTIYMLRS